MESESQAAAEIIRRIADRIAGEVIEPNGIKYEKVDFNALRNMDFNYDWLVDRFWPEGSHVHVFASPKTGKSLLMLWVAANIATGTDPFTGAAIKRQRVTYIDNEMTPKDLHDRLIDMDVDFGELEDWLCYYQYPSLPPMDTVTGGSETLALMQQDDSKVLIIDTLSRVVKGEENSNDTYREFYNHTGRLLKAHGISMLRLDHAGHDPKKSRGASAKADDVDLVFGLEKRADTESQPGYVLNRTHSRVSGVDESISLTLIDEPLSVKRTQAKGWTAQAIRKARELADLNIPLDATQRETIRLLKAAGSGPGKIVYLAEAIRLRFARETIDSLLTGDLGPGNQSTPNGDLQP